MKADFTDQSVPPAHLAPKKLDAAALAHAAESRLIRLDQIILEAQVDPRKRLRQGRVKELAGLLKRGTAFPPVDVFEEDGVFRLADGFHRHAAARQAAVESLPAQIHKGGVRDATLFAITANGSHGLRLNRKEKRAAATRILNDPEWRTWSDAEIGRRCGLTGWTISRIRKTVDLHKVRVTQRKCRGRNGRARTMDIRKLGRQSNSAGADTANRAGSSAHTPVVFEELRVRLESLPTLDPKTVAAADEVLIAHLLDDLRRAISFLEGARASEGNRATSSTPLKSSRAA